MTGASAIGVPGCPEFAFSTASMESVRMVSIESLSRESDIASGWPSLGGTLLRVQPQVSKRRQIALVPGPTARVEFNFARRHSCSKERAWPGDWPHPATYLNSTSILYIFCRV